jgi:hypothetical protein
VSRGFHIIDAIPSLCSLLNGLPELKLRVNNLIDKETTLIQTSPLSLAHLCTFHSDQCEYKSITPIFMGCAVFSYI